MGNFDNGHKVQSHIGLRAFNCNPRFILDLLSTLFLPLFTVHITRVLYFMSLTESSFFHSFNLFLFNHSSASKNHISTVCSKHLMFHPPFDPLSLSLKPFKFDFIGAVDRFLEVFIFSLHTEKRWHLFSLRWRASTAKPRLQIGVKQKRGMG